ncbi:MAG: CHASE2 domain-containing protein [Usitatibacter sp.]
MTQPERRESSATRAFAAAAVALTGLALTLTTPAERLDNHLLDLHWAALARFDRVPAPADIVIVGIDERTSGAIAAPPGLWHESIGMALVRIASAKPRAIGIDLPLPERSYDGMRPGLDRALLVGLAAARDNGPLVASLSVDTRTRGVRPINPPFLALLGEERLGISLLARDIDGVTRRFSLVVPTEDGAFPTLAGRLCRMLSRGCSEGLVNYALGPHFGYVPLQRVLATQDAAILQGLFKNRVVLLGEIQRFANRIPVPVNLAGWEEGGRESPAVVVHAQSLRTALLGAAPREASRPMSVLLVALAALLVLMRDWRHALATGILAGVAICILAAIALRAGIFVPIGGALATLVFAWIARALVSASRAFEFRRRT